MARTTHVKKAQQRYETVPVLDEDGKPEEDAGDARTASRAAPRRASRSS